MNIDTQQRLDRRTVLRGAGVSVSLPWLSAMNSALGAGSRTTPKPRFVAMTLSLGMVTSELNPSEKGRGYKLTNYLEPLGDLRDHFTVISGTSLPGVTSGHRAEASIFTGNAGAATGRNRNTISVDQRIAAHSGHETRFASLAVSNSGSSSPSYTAGGAMVPATESPSQLFADLFFEESEAERKRQFNRLRHGRTVMDLVLEDAKRLNRELGAGDRDRLDAYFTSVRELEQRLAKDEEWTKSPKPKVKAKPPVDVGNQSDVVARQKVMQDVLALALETDSTRVISYNFGGGGGKVPLDGVYEGYHSLSHHGKDESKLRQLKIVEKAIIENWAGFLRDLAGRRDGNGDLLGQTTLLLTSNLGNAANHSNKNLPVLLAGGPFRHGSHLAFDRNSNYPLSNLYVSLLQAHGVETDTFATGTGTMTGLDFA